MSLRTVARVLLALLALLATSAAGAASPGKQLWLIGGGEPLCSSVEPQFCIPAKAAEAEAWFTRREAQRSREFRVSESALHSLAGLKNWLGGNARQQQVLDGLRGIAAGLKGRRLGEPQWHAALAALNLSEEEGWLLDDACEVRPLRRDGGTRQALVFLDGSAAHAQEIFRGFVASVAERAHARGRVGRPRIVYLTASSTDPFNDVDYYGSLLEQAGAQAQWLPLEPAFVQARDCAGIEALRWPLNGVLNRNAVHPEAARQQLKLCRNPKQMLQMVEQTDGFLINGGDQSLSLRSLQTRPGEFTLLGQRLRERIEAGVPLAGTSAGTAIQSGNDAGTIPMIGDGSTAQGLRHGAQAVEVNTQFCAMNGNCTHAGHPEALQYRASGGLRVFSLGVADTHFRERGREGRLLRLLMDTHSRFGFGVDEATVLRADFDSRGNAALQVMGPGGVWIVDTRDAAVDRNAAAWAVSGFRVSRLLAGDRAWLRQGELTVQLPCAEPLDANTVLHPQAYGDEDGRHWTRLAASAVKACVSGDGQWHYDQVPMALQQSP